MDYWKKPVKKYQRGINENENNVKNDKSLELNINSSIKAEYQFIVIIRKI